MHLTLIFLILGRKEFGKRHSKFIIYAFILFILAVIIPIIAIAGFVFAYIASGASGSSVNSLQNIFLIIPFSSILGGLAYIFMLYELENRMGKYILFLAFASTIIVSFILASSIGTAFDETIGTLDFENLSPTDPAYTEKMNEFTQKISSTGIYGLPSAILMLIAYIIPYRRITSKDLIPVDTRSIENISLQIQTCALIVILKLIIKFYFF